MYAFSQFYRRLLATAALQSFCNSAPLMAHFLERPTTTVINLCMLMNFKLHTPTARHWKKNLKLNTFICRYIVGLDEIRHIPF